jgi:hypothetical protein
MSSPVSGAAEPSLLFRWDAPRSRSLAIAGFLGASVLLHGFCFYLFQVVYAPAVALLPPPARVNLITPTSEEGQTLLRWVDAEDPALASATLRPPEARQRALPKVQHIPSYVTAAAPLKHLPPLVPDTRAPSAHPPGPVPTSPRAPAPEIGVVPTRVSFSEELESFGAATLPAAQFTASNHESPEALRFRIAVNGRGEVRYCFPLNSSGDALLDGQARQQIVLGRFATRAPGAESDADSLGWGIATVQWGNDVTPPESSHPKPPVR